MSDISIIHDESMGFDASFGISFIGDNMFTIRCGNFLQICQFKDRAIEILSSISGELTGFSAMAGTPLLQTLAYADQIQNPLIHLIDVNGKETGTVSVNGTLGVKSLDFSYDGQWLYSLGGLPTFRLSAFDWQNKVEVTNMTFNAPIGQNISVCPMHPRLLAVYGDDNLVLPELPPELQDDPQPHLRFYTLQGCKEQYAFVEVIAEIDSPVTALTWSPKDECIIATRDGRIIIVNPQTGKIIGEPFKLEALEDGQQYASALFCTSKYIITSGTCGNIYWLNYEDLHHTNDLFILETGAPILFFKIFPHSNRLMFGTDRNSLICVELDENTHQTIDSGNAMTCLRETHQGPITAVCALPHQIITAGADGTLRTWTCSPYLAQTQKLMFTNESFTSLASSRGGSLVAVGSQSGVLRIINSTDPDDPVLLFRERLHAGPITSIVITDSYIASGSTTGSVVILRTDPNTCFPLIGLLQLRTSVVSLSAPPPLKPASGGTAPEQLLIATGHREIIRIDVPNEPPDNYKLQIETLNRALLKVSNKVSTITAEPTLREEQQYFFCGCDDKSVKYYCMPVTTGELDLVGIDDVECSSPDDTFTGHAKTVTAISLSPDQQFVASGCAGATLIVREIDYATAQLKRVMMTVTHHSPTTGAISGICFSPDGKKLFTVGYDGCINTYSIRVDPSPIPRDGFQVPREGAFKSSISRQFLIDHQISSLTEMWMGREYASTEDSGFHNDDGNGSEELPLAAQIKAEKEKQQSAAAQEYQKEITDQINAIKDEFMHLVEQNEKAPELEKLTKTDFTLDIASAERLQQLAQYRKGLILYRRTIKNQIRELNAEQITQRAFRPYEPKLTTIYSFKTPIHFDNFPLPIMTAKEQRRLKVVTLLRRTEIAALRYKPAVGSSLVVSQMRDSALDGSRYLFSRSNSLVTLTQSEQSDNELIVKEDERLLYDPFQLMTGNRKVTQLTIVQHLIHEAMQRFNTIFEDMMGRKANAVQSLQERNKRIRQLIRLLRLNPDDYQLFDPPNYPNEDPESFIKVRDEEVIVKKLQGQEVKENVKSDELEKDSFAQRALREMMGGNISVGNMEEAPQDDEPIAPEWMTTKKKEDMTEEEQYQVQEFEKKKKLFIEEREKRKKTLSAELVKLYKGTASTIEEFDHQMCAAYIQRIDTEEKVYYHELEIMHLLSTINSERELNAKLNAISDEIEDKKELIRQRTQTWKEISQEAVTAAKAAATADENLKSVQDQVDKDFKARDNQPQLIRWYKHAVAIKYRPKPTNKPNVFSQFIHPSIDFTTNTEEILNPANRPQNLPEQRWKNFLEYCEAKTRDSREQAERHEESNELKARENSYKEELTMLEAKTEELEGDRADTIDRLLNAMVDMHVPFTFRQGQVEIPNDTILLDYRDIVLINKRVVIAQNEKIIEAGKRKIDMLENIRRHHSEHKELRWKIAKCNVDLTNLQEEIQEYQLFRVTKLDQELIRSRLTKGQSGDDRNQKELKSLKAGLEGMVNQHKLKVEHAQANLKKLQKKLEKKKQENDKIENEILQMQLNLKERKRIYNIQMKSTEGAQDARKRRLKQVMLISKLKRAKQVQEAKIASLRDDVARLRKCVYTSFGDDDTEVMVGYKS